MSASGTIAWRCARPVVRSRAALQITLRHTSLAGRRSHSRTKRCCACLPACALAGWLCPRTPMSSCLHERVGGLAGRLPNGQVFGWQLYMHIHMRTRARACNAGVRRKLADDQVTHKALAEKRTHRRHGGDRHLCLDRCVHDQPEADIHRRRAFPQRHRRL